MRVTDRDASMGTGGSRSDRGKRSSADRKAAVEELRRQEKRKERRTTVLIISVAVGVALALIAIPVTLVIRKELNDPAKLSAASFGVPAAEAGCDDELVDEARGDSKHVPVGQRVDYPVVPPSSGEHAEEWVTRPRAFYSPEDAPEVERLVHNMEHGHLIMWYDADLPEAEREELQRLSTRLRAKDAEPSANGKVIAAPWPASEGRPPFPEGKNVAFSRWGAPAPRGSGKSWRQFCAKVSGEAAQAFSQKHPAADSPEPGAP